MPDRPITLNDLAHLLSVARDHNREHGAIFSRADTMLGALLDEIHAMTTATQTFTIEAGVAPRGRLMLPVHPIREVTGIVNASGESLPLAHFLVDARLGTIRYAGNREFSEHPYTVTVTV